jgi:glycosyltransferase involved in cell wall biosynthesis
MTTLYDGYIFRWQKEGGINRYFREIIARLPEQWAPTLIGVKTISDILPVHPRLCLSTESVIRPRKITRLIKGYWWKSTCLKRANLVHPTYYILSEGLSWRYIQCPVVLTVHDFIHASFPTLMNQADLTLKAQHTAITRADAIVCVSENTKRDLLERFPGLKAPVTVIYHGTSFPVVRNRYSEGNLDKLQFLYVGSRTGYKNFGFLLKAFSKACQSNRKLHLHVAGAPLTDEERRSISLLNLSNHIVCSVSPDETALQQLYRSSLALLYPSIHEGFGIPPLEAMACGTIPVTSNKTSLPEVMGNCGIMLDPHDDAAWTDTILAIANRMVPRQSLVEMGWARAEHFSWADSAARHISLYQALS